MTGNRFLLISRVGPKSIHRHWLAPHGSRRFDLLLSSYDPAMKAPEGDGILFEFRPGRKVAGYGEVLRAHGAMLKDYDYVALFDDDLLIDAEGISRLFEIAAAHDLKIAQPALTLGSHFTYGALLQHRGFLLRYVTYIEMMCPIFRTDILRTIAPLYDMGYESGIDLIWCNLVHETPRDFAVIDAVPVEHTRPVGTGKAANGFVAGRRYEDDIAEILHRFGVGWLPCVPYAAIRGDGRQAGRGALLPAALGLASAVSRHSGYRAMKYRARGLAVYWKHLLSAPPRNVTLGWPADLKVNDPLRRDAASDQV